MPRQKSIYWFSFRLVSVDPGSLVLCPINKLTEALALSENRVGAGGPHEGTAMQVVAGDIGVDFLYQLADAAERSAPLDFDNPAWPTLILTFGPPLFP
jgi:hypothetical protein